MAKNPAASAEAQRKLAAAELRERMRGLPPAQAEDLRRAVKFSEAGDTLMAGQLLLLLSKQAPEHPEVQRWCGMRHAGLGEWPAALKWLQQSAAQRPADLPVLLALAQAQDQTGEPAAALATLRGAATHAAEKANAADWLSLSLACDSLGHYEDALHAVQQALQLQPDTTVGLLQRSRCLKALGDAQAAAADCRRLIATHRETGRAWFSLLDLKTMGLETGELQQLELAAQADGISGEERMLLAFALGKAQEDAGHYAAAYTTLQRANHAAAAAYPWNAQVHTSQVAAVQNAFAQLPEYSVPVSNDGPDTQTQGHEVIFLVGLPRSGTTLVEQVLASHSQVEGASELPYLNQVVEAESQRRKQPFPNWVRAANAADWQRLGQDYLRLSAAWRSKRPRATDKLPENWLLAGAALAMLPGARVVDCRRDAVETCWSCYKQLFGPGRVGFTYSFEALADYWAAYEKLCRFWAAREPLRFRTQSYEALVAKPEQQIRELLAFCNLPFEAGCLQFHTAQRAIRTPSALQVRQPMNKTSTPAAGYGKLLDELRRLLVARSQTTEH
jgi:tetratricopeptide (TPR) repeat protein